MSAPPFRSTFAICCGICGAVESQAAVSIAEIPEAAADFEALGWVHDRDGARCPACALEPASELARLSEGTSDA